MANTRVANKSRAPERKKRIPVSGDRNILTLSNKDPSYHYRWVNDKDGRVNRFIEAGYDVVTHEADVGDKTVDTSVRSSGSTVTKDVGNGLTAVAMRIKREFFDEDKAAKAERVDASEKSLKRQLNNQGDGSYGKVGFE